MATSPTKSIRFAEPVSITLLLKSGPLAQRIADAKDLLSALNSETDIDALGRFETGRVVVSVPAGGGGGRAFADFHIVWPEPQLNNQHLSEFKLVNWVVGGASSKASAEPLRKKARTRLKRVLNTLTGPNGLFAGRVSVQGAAPSQG